MSKLPKSASHNTPDRKFECAVWIGIPPCLVVGRFSPTEELEEGSNTHARARRRTKKVIEYSSQKVFSFSLAHQPPIFLLVTHQPSSPVRGTLAAAGAANVWQDKQVSRSFEKKNKKKDIDLCMKLLQNVILGCCCSLSNTAPITRPSLLCSSSSVTYNSSVLFISHSVHFGGRQIRSRLLWKVRN